jgi:hypothetical protein
MNDEPREQIPLAPQDEHREELPLAPEAMSVPDANRKRLEALLRELLRDKSLREVLCKEEELTSQPQDGK